MTVPTKLKFVVVREEWSEYKLRDDGSLIKIKVSVADIVETGKTKGELKEVAFGVNNQFFKESISTDKGAPSANPVVSEEELKNIKDLEFEVILEPLNIYDVPEKFVVLMKPKLQLIKRTEKFDVNGNRIYHYAVQSHVSIVPYPK